MSDHEPTSNKSIQPSVVLQNADGGFYRIPHERLAEFAMSDDDIETFLSSQGEGGLEVGRSGGDKVGGEPIYPTPPQPTLHWMPGAAVRMVPAAMPGAAVRMSPTAMPGAAVRMSPAGSAMSTGLPIKQPIIRSWNDG